MSAELVAGIAELATRAHEGHDTAQSVWRAWSFDPELLVPVALLGAFYARGLRRWPGRARRHHWWRTALYFGGLSTLVLAIESPLDYLGHRHFSFHMLQHELLLMVATPAILLGAPTTPVLRGMPRWLRLGVVRPLARNPGVRALYRLLTRPLVGVAALTAMLYAWHLAPGWYDAALRDDLVHDAQHISYAVTGVLFWWGVIDPAPLRARMPYALRMVYLLAGSTPKHFLAALITFAGDPLYRAFADVQPVVDLSLEQDQAIGGVIMWAPSQMMHLIAAGIVFALWAQRSEREQRQREEELHEDDLRQAPAAGADAR